MKKYILALVSVSILSTSCIMAGGARWWNNASSDFEVVKAVGEPSTMTLAITDFDAIKANAPVTIEVVEGTAPGCTVTGHSNLVELIKISNDKNTLVIDVTRHNIQLDPDHPVVIRVTLPGTTIALREVSASSMAKVSIAPTIATANFALSGSGLSTITITSLTADNVSVNIHGMHSANIGNINVSGKVEAETSGMSKIVATGRAGNLDIDASGMSDANLGAMESRSVQCDVSGMSNCTVWATASLNGEASGMSHLRYIGKPTQNDISSSGMSEVSH